MTNLIREPVQSDQAVVFSDPHAERFITHQMKFCGREAESL